MKLLPPLLLAWLPLATLAAPLDPRQVPAHVEWVAHLDVEALRASELGRTFAALVAPAAKQDVVVDVDWDKVIESVASVTLYGLHDATHGGRRETVAILRGTPTFTRLVDGVFNGHVIVDDPAVVERDDFGYSAYGLRAPLARKGQEPAAKPPATKANLKTPLQPPDDREVIYAIPDETTLIVSKSRELILRAQALLSGASTEPTAANVPPLPRFLEGAKGWLFAATLVPATRAFPEAGMPPQLLALATAGVFTLGEQDGKVVLRADVVTDTDSHTRRALKMVRQIASSLTVMKPKYPALAGLLRTATASQSGRDVTLLLHQPTVEFAQMLRSMPSPSASAAK